MLLTASLVGCAQQDDARLSTIESRIAEEQARLDAVRQQVAESEARAEAARVEAEYQACRAQAIDVRAEVERRHATCAKDVADYNYCLARNSEHKAKSGLWGCGLGIAAAVFSGGAATPWAVGGCAVGVGAGELTENQCPTPECTAGLERTESDVLAERGLKELPRCGGYVGISVELPNPAIVNTQTGAW